MGEDQGNGDYVCLHCHIIYAEYGDSLRCDLCGRKLRWRDKEQVEELDRKWTIKERKRGRGKDWAYE